MILDKFPTPPQRCDECKIKHLHWLENLQCTDECGHAQCQNNCFSKFTKWAEEYARIGELLEKATDNITLRHFTKEVQAEQNRQNKDYIEPHIYITVSPPDTNEFEKFKTDAMHMQEFYSGKTEGYFTFEQTGTDPETEGKGYHLHMLIKMKYTAARYRQELRRLFPYVAGNCIQTKVRKDKKNIDGIYDYITGKKEENKMDASNYNKHWRKNCNLADLYAIKNI